MRSAWTEPLSDSRGGKRALRLAGHARPGFPFRPVALASLFLAGVAESYAGICFSSHPDDDVRYRNEETTLQQDLIQANTDYANAKLLCKGSLSCITKAEKNFENAQNNITIGRNDNNATHQKALIDIQADCDQMQLPFSKVAADNDEARRHFRALIEIKKSTVDVNTKYNNAKIKCGADRACVAMAGKTYADDQLRLQIDTNNENATHTKNQLAIDRAVGRK
jgi:hypothetical protein